MLKEFKQDLLSVRIYEDAEALGRAAAADISRGIRTALAEKPEIRMIFAAAPSQNETLAALRADPSIPWSRIHAFHMDEYVGLAADAPQGFANFLRDALFDRVPFASVNLLRSTAEPGAECERYAALLRAAPVDIVVMGIGENGHIAFNDPHVSDFFDRKTVKIVDLDETCRMQQVHDGCFAALDAVPEYALTLTVPALMQAERHYCVVPHALKAKAVRRTVEGEISPQCPATALRLKPGCTLYCDAESGAALL